MKTFIRVVELWVPDRSRTRLEFGGSLASSDFDDFTALSEGTLFAFDEGCPARLGPPVIRSSLRNSPTPTSGAPTRRLKRG